MYEIFIVSKFELILTEIVSAPSLSRSFTELAIMPLLRSVLEVIEKVKPFARILVSI